MDDLFEFLVELVLDLFGSAAEAGLDRLRNRPSLLTRTTRKKLRRTKAARRKEREPMKTLARNMVGKQVRIYTAAGTLKGILREVSDTALLLYGKEDMQVVNLDYVVRIQRASKND